MGKIFFWKYFVFEGHFLGGIFPGNLFPDTLITRINDFFTSLRQNALLYIDCIKDKILKEVAKLQL